MYFGQDEVKMVYPKIDKNGCCGVRTRALSDTYLKRAP